MYLLDHLFELFLLVLAQVAVVFDRGDVQLVLGLGLGRFERARQDGNLDVAQLLKNTTNYRLKPALFSVAKNDRTSSPFIVTKFGRAKNQSRPY